MPQNQEFADLIDIVRIKGEILADIHKQFISCIFSEEILIMKYKAAGNESNHAIEAVYAYIYGQMTK